MNFMEAVKAMKEGKKVRQQSTSNQDWNIYLSKEKGSVDFIYLHHSNILKDHIHTFNLEAIEATDWETFEEKEPTLYSYRQMDQDVWTYEEEVVKGAVNKLYEYLCGTNIEPKFRTKLIEIFGKEMVQNANNKLNR